MKVHCKPAQLTEDWASYCDSSGKSCLTVSIFDNIAKALSTDEQYLTILGRFALNSGFRANWNVYLFPNRYDEVESGKSIREWIYYLKKRARETSKMTEDFHEEGQVRMCLLF